MHGFNLMFCLSSRLSAAKWGDKIIDIIYLLRYIGVMFNVELELIKDWLDGLDKDSATQVYAALQLLQQYGPQLRRPIVGKIEGSHIQNLKELRPGSSGRSEVRILFVFDPSRQAVMLVGGDKQNKWNKWYRKAIDEAEARYEKWLSDHSE